MENLFPKALEDSQIMLYTASTLRALYLLDAPAEIGIGASCEEEADAIANEILQTMSNLDLAERN